MPSVALCPRCQGIIAIENLDDASRQWRCPRCAANFSTAEAFGTAVAEPPLAMPVDGEMIEAGAIATTEPTPAVIEAVAPLPETPVAESESPSQEAVALSDVINAESAGDAWTESLSAAEGALFVSGDDDETMSRPYHDDPEYNTALSVEKNNGSAWPELAAALAAEGEAASITSNATATNEPMDVPVGESQPFDAASPSTFEPAETLELREPDAWGNVATIESTEPVDATSSWASDLGEAADVDDSVLTVPGEDGGFAMADPFAGAMESAETSEFEAPRPVRRRQKGGGVIHNILLFVGIAIGGVIGLGLGYLFLRAIGKSPF